MITSVTLFEFYLYYLLMGISVIGTAFNVSHDACHGIAVKSKFWNKILFSLSFNLQGNNAYVWGKNHNESHHLYTNIEGSDIDVLNNPLFRMTESQELRLFHKYQYIYAPFMYLLYTLNWIRFRDSLMLLNYTTRTLKLEMPFLEIVKLIFWKVFYLLYMLVLPVYLLPEFGVQTVLLAFLLNHFIASIISSSVNITVLK